MLEKHCLNQCFLLVLTSHPTLSVEQWWSGICEERDALPCSTRGCISSPQTAGDTSPSASVSVNNRCLDADAAAHRRRGILTIEDKMKQKWFVFSHRDIFSFLQYKCVKHLNTCSHPSKQPPPNFLPVGMWNKVSYKYDFWQQPSIDSQLPMLHEWQHTEKKNVSSPLIYWFLRLFAS